MGGRLMHAACMLGATWRMIVARPHCAATARDAWCVGILRPQRVSEGGGRACAWLLLATATSLPGGACTGGQAVACYGQGRRAVREEGSVRLPCPGSCLKWARVPEWECQGSQVTPAQHTSACLFQLWRGLWVGPSVMVVSPGPRQCKRKGRGNAKGKDSHGVCLLAPKAYYVLACRRQAGMHPRGWACACTIGCLAADLHTMWARDGARSSSTDALHLELHGTCLGATFIITNDSMTIGIGVHPVCFVVMHFSCCVAMPVRMFEHTARELEGKTSIFVFLQRTAYVSAMSLQHMQESNAASVVCMGP